MTTIRKLHRWLSVIIVLQVLVWLVTGLYFSFVGQQRLANEEFRQPVPEQPIGAVFYPKNALLERFDHINTLELRSIAGTPQYVVTRTDGVRHYINAQTGEDWSTPLPLARTLARHSYNGPGNVQETRVVAGSDEIEGWTHPGFKITFSDALQTRVYVDGVSGEVVAHRNNQWWLHDWMFRLHFMDYSGGRDINNLFITIAATLALWFSLSGLIMLGQRIKRRQLF